MAEHRFGPRVYGEIVGRDLREGMAPEIQTSRIPDPSKHLATPKNPQNVLRTLPVDPGQRKTRPIATGVVDYFPLALAAVAQVSKAGNDQHNPGQPLNWNRGKSADHADCILRHLIERGTNDSTDGMRHSAKLAWRALALLQEELEAEAGFDPNANPRR